MIDFLNNLMLQFVTYNLILEMETFQNYLWVMGTLVDHLKKQLFYIDYIELSLKMKYTVSENIIQPISYHFSNFCKKNQDFPIHISVLNKQ